MKYWFLVILTCFVSTQIYSQKSNEYNWYLSLSGLNSNIKTELENGKATGGRGGFEYRPNPYIGFGLGVSSNKYNIQSTADPLDTFFTLMMFSSFNQQSCTYSYSGQKTCSSSMSPFTLLMLLSAMESSQPVSFNTNTIDLIFNFHPNKDSVVDPYIGLGVIVGNCAGGANCNINGLAARLGLQFNFDSIFLFVQGEARAMKFTGVGTVNVQESQGSAGIGFRL